VASKHRRKHLSNAYKRHQRATIESERDPSYAQAILEELDEEYVAHDEHWEEESEEIEVLSSDDKYHDYR